jgi:NTP pyrophosphatase (non-canonical NTP hydrolase)
MELQSLIQRLRTFRDQRGWRKYHTPKNLAISISIEAAELLELFQWIENEDEVLEKQKERVEEEIADIFIYLLFFCDAVGIDIVKAAERKMDKNERKYPPDTRDLWG